MAIKLGGLIPPIITPLRADLTVDVESLRAVVEFQLDAGAAGIFALGSSGEAIYRTDDDRKLIVDVVVSQVNGRVPVLVGAVDATTERVIQQLDWIEESGAAGAVVTGPFYANVSVAETEEHFRNVAGSTTLPLLAYDIPVNTHCHLNPNSMARLLGESVLAGLKDSSGALLDFRRIVYALGPHRQAVLLSGADTTADLALQIGADGLIPGLANVRPDLFATLLRATNAADMATVELAQRQIMILSAIYDVGERYGLGRHASELGAMKHALRRRGVIATALTSLPMAALPPAACREVDSILDRVGPTPTSPDHHN